FLHAAGTDFCTERTMQCPECGAQVNESDVVCPNCGAALADEQDVLPVTCEHCGEQIAGDAEACPACGELRVSATCARHPDRPAAGQCVVCGRALCPDCNEGGDTHYLCDRHSEIPVVNGW